MYSELILKEKSSGVFQQSWQGVELHCLIIHVKML